MNLSLIATCGMVFFSVMTGLGQGVGVNTSSPNRMLDVLDAGGNAQLRLSYDASNYVELEANSTGYLGITPSGKRVGINTDAPAYMFQLSGSETNNTANTRAFMFSPTIVSNQNGIGGGTFITNIQPTANITTSYGLVNTSYLTGSGNITNYHHTYLRPNASAGYTGTITNSHTIYVNDLIVSGGAVDNQIGLYMADLVSGGTDNWALYVDGTTKSYFGGNVGIGSTTPDNLLHLYSTTTTGTDFKIQSGDTGGRSWQLKSTGSASTGGAGNLMIRDATAAASRVLINSSGDVGIGTTGPETKLHVSGGAASANVMIDGTGAGVILRDNDGTADAKTAQQYIYSDDIWRLRALDNSLVETYAGISLNMTNGYVGVGTNNPGFELHVSGTGAAQVAQVIDNLDNSAGSLTLLSLRGTGTSGTSSGMGRILAGKDQQWTSTASTRDGYLTLDTREDNNMIERLRITSAGDVGIGVSAPEARLNIGGGNIQIGYVGNTGGSLNFRNIANSATSPVLWVDRTDNTLEINILGGASALDFNNTSSTSVMRIENGGDVGIGTTNPTHKLEVFDSVIPIRSWLDWPSDDNTVRTVMEFYRTYDGAGGANGIGSRIAFHTETSTNGTYEPIGLIDAGTTDVTAGSVDSYIALGAYNNSGGNYTLYAHGSGEVTIGSSTANASAKLEIKSTTQGVLFPRMTAAQGSAITGVDGLVIYVNSTNGTFTSVGFWGYENGSWVKL